MKAWLALAASGVLCTATTTLLWNWGMTQVPASQAGVLLNMEPLIGSLLGVLVLGEQLGPTAWAGGGLILAAAITLTTHSKAHVAGTPAGGLSRNGGYTLLCMQLFAKWADRAAAAALGARYPRGYRRAGGDGRLPVLSASRWDGRRWVGLRRSWSTTAGLIAAGLPRC